MSRSYQMHGLALLCALFLSPLAFSQGEITIPGEYDKLIKTRGAIEPLEKDIFGEQLSLYTGDVEWTQTDVELPGNNAIPVRIGRRFTVNQPFPTPIDHFSDWQLDIPHLHGVFGGASWNSVDGGACSNFWEPEPVHAMGSPDGWFYAKEYWHGNFLYMPGRGDSEMLRINNNPGAIAVPSDAYRNPGNENGYVYPVNTKDGVVFRCIGSGSLESGQLFEAAFPDGTRIRFNYPIAWMTTKLKKGNPGPFFTGGGGEGGGEAMSAGDGEVTPMTTDGYMMNRYEVRIMPTLVTDRFGNRVKYNWSGRRLLGIFDADANGNPIPGARQLTLTYDGTSDRILTVSDGTRTWTYNYEFFTSPDRFLLTSVQLPNTPGVTPRFWTFNLNQIRYMEEYVSGGACGGAPGSGYPELTGSMTHPDGATGTFTINPVTKYRSYVPPSCENNEYDKYPVGSTNPTLTSKSYSGAGISTPLTWTYSHGSGAGCYSGSCTAGPDNRMVTVTEPSTTVTRYSFGNRFNKNEGQMLRVEVGRVQSNVFTALRTTDHKYASPTAGPYPTAVGTSPTERGDNYLRTRHAPLESTVITEGGSSYSTVVGTQAANDGFDTKARPTSVTKSGPAGSRTDVTAYEDHCSSGQPTCVTTSGLFVLGLVKSRTNIDSIPNLVERDIEYDDKAMPNVVRAFGRTLQTAEYNTAEYGVTGGDGTLKSVADGLNRTTEYSNWKRGVPQRITYADGKFEDAEVSNEGWITSVTDERGYQSTYQYNPVGRLTKEIYPQGDTVNWTPRSVEYTHLAANDPSGALQVRETYGQERPQVTTYYDALLRPLLIEKLDTATGAATYTKKSYVAATRTNFTSYPKALLAETSAGVYTKLDWLGRLEQRYTADAVNLETRTYPSGHVATVTDADARTTTITYQAFGEPSYERPVTIAAPLDQTTAIIRDRFGKMTSVTQSGTWTTWSGGTQSATAMRTFEYDADQILCRRVDPESGSTVWGYDLAGQVIWELKGTTGSGCVTSEPAGATKFLYWPRGNKQKDDYPGTADDVTYGYDFSLNLTSVVNATATWSYGYNGRNLIESEQALVDSKTFTLDPQYNVLAQVDTLVTPMQTIAYAPDPWGRPTRLNNYIQNITYQPNSLPKTYSLGNGLNYIQELDNQQRPSLQKTLDNGAIVQQYGYTYFPSGDLETITDADGANSLSATYDELHRLKTATGLWGRYRYVYDTLNNIRSRNIGPDQGTLDLEYKYNSLNRLYEITGSQSRNYSYNEQGEITGDGAKTFALNALGQIKSVLGFDYAYDGNGKRIKTTKPDGIVEYTLYNRAGALVYTHTVEPASEGAMAAPAAEPNAVTSLLAPAAPTGMTPGNWASPGPTQSNPSVTLGWEAPTLATEHVVKVVDDDTGSTASETTLQEAVSLDAFTNRHREQAVALTWGHRYRWTVMSCNPAACSPASEVRYFQIAPAPPGAPTNASPGTASAPGPTLASTSVTFTWSATANATRYHLYAVNTSTGGTAADVYVTGTSYVANLAYSTPYRWSVQACDNLNCGQNTALLYFQTPANTGIPPPTPVNPSPGNLSAPGPTTAGSSVTVSWSASSGATSYNLAIVNNSTGVTAVSTSVAGTSYGAALSYATGYRWTVSACNTAGCSAATASRYFQTPQPPAPATPANPSPGTTSAPGPTTGGKSVTFSWSASANATSYNLTVVNASSGATVVSASPAGTSYSATLLYSTAYRWTVAACNTAGCSSATVNRYFQTPAAPPPVETKTDYLSVGGQTVVEVKQVGTAAATTTWLHPDLLGSPRKATDESGNEKWSEHYDPYGVKMNGVSEKIGYTGHADDPETGYTYMQARFYDPQVGRFLSTDPVGFSDKSPFTFNRYSYANNNPYRYKDPDGRWVDAVIDAFSIGYDIGSMIYSGATGDMGGVATNAIALVADVGSLVTPGATGGGAAVRATAQAEKGAAIAGKAQVTRAGGKETTHAATSQRIANEQAARPDAKSVHLNQTISTVTGGDTKSALRPDVATVRSDGKVDVNEVLSPGQDGQATASKYENALGSSAGQVTCHKPDC